jgi:hypothetical protein
MVAPETKEVFDKIRGKGVSSDRAVRALIVNFLQEHDAMAYLGHKDAKERRKVH